MNSTKDVLLSLFRSRDDNLIWVASNLLCKVLSSATKETLTATKIIDREKPTSPLFLLLGFIHGLLGTESDFRIITIRSLGNLLQTLIKLCELTYDQLPAHLQAEFTKHAANRLDSLQQLLSSKQNLNIALKMFNAAALSYGYAKFYDLDPAKSRRRPSSIST